MSFKCSGKKSQCCTLRIFSLRLIWCIALCSSVRSCADLRYRGLGFALFSWTSSCSANRSSGSKACRFPCFCWGPYADGWTRGFGSYGTAALTRRTILRRSWCYCGCVKGRPCWDTCSCAILSWRWCRRIDVWCGRWARSMIHYGVVDWMRWFCWDVIDLHDCSSPTGPTSILAFAYYLTYWLCSYAAAVTSCRGCPRTSSASSSPPPSSSSSSQQSDRRRSRCPP